MTPEEIQAHGRALLAGMDSPYNTSEATAPPMQSVGTPAYAAQPEQQPVQLPPPVPPPPPNNAPQAPINKEKFGAGVTNENSPFYVKPPSLDPETMLALDAKERAGLRQGQHNVNDAQISAANARAQADMAQAGAENKVYDAHENETFASMERERLAKSMYDADVNHVFQEKQSAIQAQTDIANAMPTDLWGASGVNKIAGIIGLALGTLGGSSTGGQNSALQAMKSLADQNLRQMKMKYDMYGDKVKGLDSTYAQMRQKFGDDHSAELATRVVMNENFINNLKKADLSVIDKVAKANLQKTIADATQQNQNLGVELYKASANQVDHAASIGVQRYGIDAAHAEHDETIRAGRVLAGASVPGEIYGMTAPSEPSLRLSKAATDKVREEQQGVKKIIMTVDNIKNKIVGGTLKDEASRNKLEADLKIALIEADGLSKRVGGSEGELVAQKAGSLSIGWKGFVTGRVDRVGLLQMINELKQTSEEALIGGMVANGYSVTPGGQYDHSSDGSGGQSEYDKLEAIPTRGQPQALPQYSTKTGAAG